MATTFTLSNGLSVVLLEAGEAPIATVLVLYKVGSRNEAVGHTGAAHLLEHMLFKGTERNNAMHGHSFMDAMLEIGANVNANTWLDRTMYYETVPVEYVPFALELEADRMLGALISDEARRAEMTVVRNELEQRAADPHKNLGLAQNAIAYMEHPYHHPTIGWRTDVENMSTARLQEFYRTFYRPDNATLFVVGNINMNTIESEVHASFGKLRTPSSAIPEVYTSEPPQLGERSLEIKWPGNASLITWVYHIPGALGHRYVLSSKELQERSTTPGALSESCALEVLENVLAAGASSRLHRRLVDSGLAHTAWAQNGVLRDPALFSLGVAVQPGKSLEAASSAMAEEIGAILSDGISDAELSQAKASIAAGRVYNEENIETRAFALAEWEARGGWKLHSEYQDGLQNVTLEDVRRVAKTYLYEDNRTVARLVPGTPALFSIPIADAVSYQEKSLASMTRPPLPVPSRPVLARFATRIVREGLAENIGWNFVRNDVTPAVHLRGLIQTEPTFSGTNSECAAVTARMLARGTVSRERLAINTRLRELGASREYGVDGAGGNPLAFRFEAASLSGPLAEVFAIIVEELSEPRFSQHDFDLIREELKGRLWIAQTNTTVRARQRLLELLYPREHPNYECRIEQRIADIEAMTLDDVRSYHHHLLSRGRLILSIVGDSAPLQLERLLGDSFGRLPLRKFWEADVRVHQNGSKPERSFVELERKPSADVFIGRATLLTRKSADYQATVLANQVLCGHAISGRLGHRLRVMEGLTYGAPGGLYGVGLTPGFWNARISTNPANVDAVISSALEVLDEYAKRGATPREVTAAKSTTIGRTLVALGNNAGIARMIEAIDYYGLGVDYVDTLYEEITSVSAEEIHRVGADLFDPHNLTIVTAGSMAPDKQESSMRSGVDGLEARV